MSSRLHSNGVSPASSKPKVDSGKASSTGTTIAAVATAPGVGGIAVVRISGPSAGTIARAVLGTLPAPRHARHCTFRDADGAPIDRGIALYFPAPHSFTGEDVIELHAHGAPVVLDMLLTRVLSLGARLARPGEFSERAFLNGKMDLAQAEAVADLINAGSAAAVRSALNSLNGELSRRIGTLVNELITLRAHVEAAIDFPDEDVDPLADTAVRTRLTKLEHGIAELQRAAQQGCLLNHGMTIVLAGRPNAGKSSLLNALAATDAAMVSPIPGTTRDVVRERINLDGLPLHVLDTAGLREGGDALEAEGMTRAKNAMARADRIVVVLDDAASAYDSLDGLFVHLPQNIPRTLVYNKIDITGREPGELDSGLGPAVALSAKTGTGIDAFRSHLKRHMGYLPAGEGTFIARRRHLDALGRAASHLADARAQLHGSKAGELMAEDLRQAQRALGEITGEFTPDDLLARIFSTFCIGK